MTENLNLLKVRIPGVEGLQRVIIQQNQVAAIVPMSDTPSQSPALDLEGDWLSLGGIDLQINGALGLAFPDLTPEHQEKLEKICQFLWQQGVDGFVPTIVTTTLDKIHRSLTTLKSFLLPPSPSSPLPTSTILGVHLEGPFLNPQKRGAHPAEYLQPLTLENVKRVLGDYGQAVKIMTLAPELDRTDTVIPYLRSLGIIVSLGHSMATAEQANCAFAQGATMVTHAFNAMPPLHHREPGLLGAAIVNPSVSCGLIADGQHVSPIMVDILLRASCRKSSGLDQQGIFLVSDALAPLGLPDGTYPWDIRQIEVKDGTAHLPDGILSGTTLPLLAGVQNLVKWGICDVEAAIALATLAPRRAIGLATGYTEQPVTHLLRWHQSEEGQVSWRRLVG
jgi:N-acetylglucosamine-6-phosphate deacetylase